MLSRDIKSSITISNMSDELFNDALYFREQIEKTEEYFIVERFKRVSIICFCASTESWMNTIIKENLSGKVKLSDIDTEVLKFINDPNKNIPKYFNSVKNKLYNFVPRAINGQIINWYSDKQKEFEKYIELSEIRNNIVHFSRRSSQVIHSDKVDIMIKEAPDIVENLFNKYSEMGSVLKTPEWFKFRQSRLI